MDDDKLVKEVSNLRKSINFLCFLLVAFALVFCGVKLKEYICFRSVYSSVIGTGDTMEEAEEDAERNANR